MTEGIDRTSEREIEREKGTENESDQRCCSLTAIISTYQQQFCLNQDWRRTHRSLVESAICRTIRHRGLLLRNDRFYSFCVKIALRIIENIFVELSC